MDATLRGVREGEEQSAGSRVRVVVVGDAAGVERDLADQVSPPRCVESVGSDGLATAIREASEEFILVASTSARFAPAALAAGVAALATAPSAAAAVVACEVGALMEPAVEKAAAAAGGSRATEAILRGDVAALLLAAVAGVGPLPEQILFRRTALEDAFGPGSGREFSTAALALLARHEVVFVAKRLVRSAPSGSGLQMGEEFLGSELLEDLCFRLGGGAWTADLARAEARASIQAALAGAGRDLRVPGLSDMSAVLRAELPLKAVPPIPGWNLSATADPIPAALLESRATRRTEQGRYRATAQEHGRAARACATLARDSVAPSFPLPSPLPGPASAPPGTGSAERLRVALMVSRLDSGGLESVVRDLAIGLPAHGFTPLLICEKGGGQTAGILRAAGIPVFCLGENDPVGELALLLDQLEIDVLATHDAWMGVPLAVARDIPVVAVLHNEYGWLGAGPDDPMAALDPLISGYVAVSESVRTFHAARFDILPERIAVVRNAPSQRVAGGARPQKDQARAELDFGDNETIFLCVGRIEPVKGQIVLVEAFARRLAAGLCGRLLIVGGVADALYAERLRVRIEALGLSAAVHILGVRDDIPRLLAAADLFVLPSLFEGLSLAAAEALQAGVPAVLSPTGDAEFLLGFDCHAAPAGVCIERPAADPHSLILGELIRRAAEPDEGEIRALDEALARVLADLPAFTRAAAVRAETLAGLLDPARPIREHASLLRAAVAARVPSHLPAARVVVAAARDSAWREWERHRRLLVRQEAARLDRSRLSRRIRRCARTAWRRLRPA